MSQRSDAAERLAAAERRYRELARGLAEVGLIQGGSLVRRYTRCANPNCRCRAEPPHPHGPYWQWSAKVDGRTVTRRLSESEAARYEEWIANDRRLRRLITQMRRVAGEATQLILQADQPPATRSPRLSRGQAPVETVGGDHITERGVRQDHVST
ncbi:MAG: DUF6788 family protein [Mycobacteriales bacterium]